MSNEQKFDFKYMMITCSITVSETKIQGKHGLRKPELYWKDLRYLYVYPQSDQWLELTLMYEPEPGKRKAFRMYANQGDPGFQQAIEAIVARKPEIDLRKLSPKEAHEKMGVANTETRAFWIIAALLLIGVTIGGMPSFLHGIDNGKETVPIEKFSENYQPSTRNLSVVGELSFDNAIEEETTYKGSTTIQLYVPIVPTGWTKEKPVYAVLKTPDLTNAEVAVLAGSSSVDGMLRNIWWEGLDSDVQEFFKTKFGLTVADNVVLVQYKSKPEDEILILPILFGIGLFIMGIFALVLWNKRRKEAKAARS